MAKTYEPIATITPTGSQTTVTFSNIPGTFTDLVIVAGSVSASAGDQLFVRFNSDTASNYSRTWLRTPAGSERTANATLALMTAQSFLGSTHINTSVAHVMNYSNTTTNKTMLARNSGTRDGVDLIVNLWRSTAAITSITLLTSGNFTNTTVFSLYGIKAA